MRGFVILEKEKERKSLIQTEGGFKDNHKGTCLSLHSLVERTEERGGSARRHLLKSLAQVEELGSREQDDAQVLDEQAGKGKILLLHQDFCMKEKRGSEKKERGRK